MNTTEYQYEVTYINQDGNRLKKTVTARHEFEATQKAGAFGCVVLSVINLDL